MRVDLVADIAGAAQKQFTLLTQGVDRGGAVLGGLRARLAQCRRLRRGPGPSLVIRPPVLGAADDIERVTWNAERRPDRPAGRPPPRGQRQARQSRDGIEAVGASSSSSRGSWGSPFVLITHRR
jgi:hypothetical protein